MKLVIPATVQIGAHENSIVWSPKVLDLMDCKGNSEYRNGHVLRLMPGRPVSQSFQTLIHEAIHQVDHVFGVGDLSEDMVCTLSGGLCQFLMSLGIEPDFSQVQREVL